MSSQFTHQAGSDVLVLPVARVVNDTFTFDVAVESVVGGHTCRGQVRREFAVEAVQDGSLRGDLRRFSSHILRTRLVDDLVVAGDDICNRRNNKNLMLASSL